MLVGFRNDLVRDCFVTAHVESVALELNLLRRRLFTNLEIRTRTQKLSFFGWKPFISQTVICQVIVIRSWWVNKLCSAINVHGERIVVELV